MSIPALSLLGWSPEDDSVRFGELSSERMTASFPTFLDGSLASTVRREATDLDWLALLLCKACLQVLQFRENGDEILVVGSGLVWIGLVACPLVWYADSAL